MVQSTPVMTEEELRDYFRSGSQIWDIGPNNTRLPLGWGKTKTMLEADGFTKRELEKYVRKGILGKTVGVSSKGKTILTRTHQVIYYFQTSEKLHG